jgi:ABC-type transport system involved in multi-copper enzyme maturation permease subunit
MRRSSTRWSAVKAMVWKEVRERFLLTMVVLAAAATVLTLACVLTYDDATSWTITNNNGFLGLWDFAQSTVIVAVPLFALCLGFLQMNGEGSRDAWAFLVHRPVTRAALFWGKVLAGIGLCALVVVVVYGGFVLWMALLVRAPIPFSWWLLGFALVAMALSGLLYFVGALLALRQRSWFGSRSLPLLALPVFCIALFSISSLAPQTLLFYLGVGAAIAVLALAAQGCFQNQTLVRRKRWAQVASGIVLLAGLYAVASAVNVLGALLYDYNRNASPLSTAQYEVTEQGRILLRRTSYHRTLPTVGQELFSETLSEPNGKLVTRGSGVGNLLNFNAIQSEQSSVQIPLFTYSDLFVSMGQSIEGVMPDGINVAWWFDLAHRRLIGIETVRRRIYGYIGANGFARDAEKCVSFPEQLLINQAASGWLIFPHSLYRFDLQNKTVTKFYDSPQEIKNVVSDVVSTSLPLIISSLQLNNEPLTITQIVTRQNDVVFLTEDPAVSTRGTPLLLHPVAHIVALPDASNDSISFAQKSNGSYWLRFMPDSVAPVTMIELSPHGESVKKTTLPPLPVERDSVSWNARTAASLAYAIMPAAWMKWGAHLMFNTPTGDVLTYDYAINTDVRLVLETLLLAFAFSAIAALATWRRASRYAFPSSTRLWWTIGVFAVGPLGYLLMRSLLDWPALEKCSSCGKLRVVDRELCEHCNSPFAPPLLDGTEIIENAAPEMPALRLAS